MDAFTSDAFRGNPAAVVLLAPFTTFPPDHYCQVRGRYLFSAHPLVPPRACDARSDAFAHLPQSVAAEFNQSETAFVLRRADGPGYALRWFTPTTEVDLCGARPPRMPGCHDCAAVGTAAAALRTRLAAPRRGARTGRSPCF